MSVSLCPKCLSSACTALRVEGMPPLTAAQKRQKEKDKKRRQKEMDQIKAENAQHDLCFGSPGDLREEEMTQIGKQLAVLQRVAVEMPSDGNCLFHALSHQHKSASHTEMRKILVDHIRLHPDDFAAFIEAPESSTDPLGDYCNSMGQDGAWGSIIEVRAAADCFQVPIAIVAAAGTTVVGGDVAPHEAPWAVVFYEHLFTLGSHFNATEHLGCAVAE